MEFIYMWLLEGSLQLSSAIEVYVFVRLYSEIYILSLSVRQTAP